MLLGNKYLTIQYELLIPPTDTFISSAASFLFHLLQLFISHEELTRVKKTDNSD